jgi:aerobic carbon-monoxide dehydrogenase medium subunit
MYAFDYQRPTSLAAALAVLADDSARVVSGGQTLLPVLRARLASPATLVDVARLAELKGIRQEGSTLVIGAAETHADVAASAVVRQTLPALAALAGQIGDVQVRHRGTLGGSVANNDPAACYPSALMALEATVHTNRRKLAAADFFTGMFSTALETGELVTAVSFPACSTAAYVKFHNPASRFALIGVFAAKVGGKTRLAVTGGGSGVFRWTAAEQHLDGGGAVAGLATVALDVGLFTGDLHGSAEYRAHLTRVVSARALDKALAKA